MTRLRKLARNQECQIRVPGACNGDCETTVLAHLPGGGMGTKRADIHGAWSCSSCHDIVDRRVRTQWSPSALRSFLIEGVIRTQDKLIQLGALRGD